MQVVETFEVRLLFEVTVDESTGELTTHCVKKSIDKTNFKSVEATKKPKKVKNESTTPELTLEDNKFCLNNAAIELMGLTPDSKLDVKYEKRDSGMIPVIGTDEAFGTKGGNKLTKSNTVACRGSKNEELSKYGRVFSITPHSTKEGLFILTGDATSVTASQGDENISIDDADEDLPLDLDLSALVDEKDANIEEIDSSYFQL